MAIFGRSIVNFERAGPPNTKSVIKAVRERLSLGDIREVSVPFTTGKTAKLFGRELKDAAEVVTVSEDEAMNLTKAIAHADTGLFGALIHERLEEAARIASRRLRREAFDITFLPLSGEGWEAAKEALYAFGQGMKVAVEVSIAAVELKKVEPYTKIVSVGGSEGGVDTAIVLRTSSQKESFGKDYKKRLAVQEIICMPIEKI